MKRILVLGGGFNHNEKLKEVIQMNTSLSKVDVFRSIDNIAEMMMQRDVICVFIRNYIAR